LICPVASSDTREPSRHPLEPGREFSVTIGLLAAGAAAWALIGAAPVTELGVAIAANEVIAPGGATRTKSPVAAASVIARNRI
jgi:hypothetical protein